MTTASKSRSRSRKDDLDRGGGPTRAVRQLPEPVHFWIAHAPRSWRFCSVLWSDLARGKLGGFKRSTAEHDLPEYDLDHLDDLFYVPPVNRSLAGRRTELLGELVAAGVPALVQLWPGETIPKKLMAAGEGLLFPIYDLLQALLKGEVEQILKLPEGATVVWPLIPGISDHVETWEEGCELLAAKNVASVQPLTLSLEAKERRALAEGRPDHTFDALFHGSRPSEHRFGRVACEHGLSPWTARPPTGRSRLLNNRRLAAHLALAGEMCLRLERVSQGQGLLRAARGAESTSHDLEALAREGNLRVMDWLDRYGLVLVKELADEGESELYTSILQRYLGLVDGDDEEE
ncbi:MAG: hypothetical protein MPN21_07965 [Thermoanaerobaculia bacterium]|nr:hypothetical protein [Thermoanaerobaculia bacterium]